MRWKKKKAQRAIRSTVQFEKQNSVKQGTDLGCYVHRRVGCMGMGVYP